MGGVEVGGSAGGGVEEHTEREEAETAEDEEIHEVEEERLPVKIGSVLH